MKKRIIATLLVLFTIISCVYPNASAYDLDETTESTSDSYYNEEIPTDRIISALSSIERSKEVWGLADIDFENIYIGNPVYTYYRYHCVGMNRDRHLGAILVHAEEE